MLLSLIWLGMHMVLKIWFGWRMEYLIYCCMKAMINIFINVLHSEMVSFNGYGYMDTWTKNIKVSLFLKVFTNYRTETWQSKPILM
jgi:hypothetical protein